MFARVAAKNVEDPFWDSVDLTGHKSFSGTGWGQPTREMDD